MGKHSIILRKYESTLLPKAILERISPVTKDEVIDMCATRIRHDCSNCKGTGYDPSSLRTDENGNTTGDQCEYCGRPISAINILKD